MTLTEAAGDATSASRARVVRSDGSFGWRSLAQFARSKPLGAVGGVLIAGMAVVAILAPVLAPYDPYALDSSRLFAPPSAANWLGTDQFGRDVLSRIIWGARLSLYVGFLAVGLGTTLGSLIGLAGGYLGGRIDFVSQRIMDSFMAFPTLVLALTMVAVLGSGINNVVLALAIVAMPSAARVIRSRALSVREMAFVESARAIGCSEGRILFQHVLPNCLAPYIILATAGLGNAILSEASLSFLGLGAPAPEPSWGAMLSGNTQRYVQSAPWLAVFPGLAITLAVFGFNFLGDALRDVLDPRLRRR